MKRNLVLLGLLLFAALSSLNAVDISGDLKSDIRAFTKDGSVYWNQNTLNLKLEHKSAGAAAYSEFELRTQGFPDISSSSDLMAFGTGKTDPLNLQLKEAYVDLYGFLLPNMDLRIGKQRIAWGTADKFNPTDNINPDDLEDIFDFGKHLATPAVNAKTYLGDYTLSLIYSPIFEPAKMPYSEWASAFLGSMPLPLMPLAAYSDQVVLPENKIEKSSSYAAKISKTYFDFDFSLSYYKGRDDIPLLNYVKVAPADTNMPPTSINADVHMVYPEMQVLGLDMAGQIKDVGVWGELGTFFPKKQYLTQDLSALGMGIVRSVALDDTPYMKAVIGADYTFENGIYVNCQYIHGFLQERGGSNLEDYLVMGLEKKFFEDKLNIKPVTLAAEIKDFDNIAQNYALVYSPMLTYKPYDNIELNIGAIVIYGKGSTAFGQLQDKDTIFSNVKYSF